MSTEIALEQELHPLIKKAEAFEIKDAKSMTAAVEMLSELNRAADKIENEKAKVMRPLLDAVAAERGRWKPFETLLASPIATMRSKISKYQTAAKAKEKEEADKLAARVAKGTLKADTAVRKLDELPTAAAKVETDNGSVKFRTIRVFEIKDITKIPYTHLMPNEVLIRADMKKGIEHPGIEYRDEEQPINSRA